MRLVKYRGAWCVSYPGPDGTKRVSLRLSASADRETAERALNDYRRSLVRPAETAGDVMALYLADKEHTATSIQRLRDAWKALASTFGHLRPDQIDRPLSRAYAAKRRREGRQDGTICKELATLRAALRWHSNKKTPAVIELPRMPPPKNRVISRDEVERLIDAAEAHHVKLAIRLLWATAARKEAILSLRWGQIDFERGIITLADNGDGKRRKNRATVPLGDNTRAALLEAKRAALTDYVIEWAEKPVKSIRTGFDRAVERAGLKDVTPHVLRHSAAVAMAEAGIPMAEIAQYLGHSDVSVTFRVYARYSPDYLRRAASVLD